MKLIAMVRGGIVKEVIPIPILLALLVLLSYCVDYAPALEHKCIHDTEKMQTLFYGPVVDNITGLRHAFTPQGILERTVPQKYQPMPPPDAPDEVHRAFHATAVGNIRIATSTLDLYEAGKFCTRINDVVPNFDGSTVRCASQDNILTDAKRDILLKVLKDAIALLSYALKVNRVQGNLITKGCSHYTIPPSHSTTGTPNADFVIYVSAGPTPEGTKAFAAFCERDIPGRPISGYINFGPKYLEWDAVDTLGRRELVRTAAHEMMHALGFHNEFWDTYPKPKGIITCIPKLGNCKTVKTEKRRGKTVHYFTTKKVVEKAREYFDCPTLSGPELEDEGLEEGSRLKYSAHWKRKYHFDDIMSGAGSRRSYLSHITLASFEDSGHYFINWDAAETPKWMYKAGCGVFEKKCNTKAGGMGKYFCDNVEHKKRCTPDHDAFGVCDIIDHERHLPSWGRYFKDNPFKGGSAEMMDYCPVAVDLPGYMCDNPANRVKSNTIVPMYFGTDGRCFESDGVIKESNDGRDRAEAGRVVRANCLQTRCSVNLLQFKIPDNKAWITCPSEGATVSLSQYGYKGSVTCPNPNIICDVYN